jgi:hypothetical protein
VSMSTRMHITVEDELLARIDAARHPDQSRAAFARRAIERELNGPTHDSTAVVSSPPVTHQKAKRMTPEELDPYFDAIQEKVKPPVEALKEGLAVQATIVPQTPAEKALMKAVKPMVYCTVCDRTSLDTHWGCPDHGYGKVKPFRERGL